MQRYPEIVAQYRARLGKKRPISREKFSASINRYLHPAAPRKAAHWCHIEKGIYKPDLYTMDYLSVHAEGWVKDMAVELKQALEEEWENSK